MIDLHLFYTPTPIEPALSPLLSGWWGRAQRSNFSKVISHGEQVAEFVLELGLSGPRAQTLCFTTLHSTQPDFVYHFLKPKREEL